MLPPSETPDHKFVFSEVTTSMVLTHLKSLDVRKSAGPNNSSAKFLKEVADEIAVPLTRLFNFSLQHGTFLLLGNSQASPQFIRPGL